MNGLRETCKCGHDRATHYADLPSTGDVTKPAESGRLVYLDCLGSWCNCRRYEPEDPK